MPYFFRCDYCNTESSMNAGEDFSMYISCEDCGQDLCPECAIKVGVYWICDICEDRRSEIDKEEDQ